MKRKVLMLFPTFFLLLPFLFYGAENAHAIRLDTGRSTIQGYVFFDKNQNSILEYKTEYPGLPGIRIMLLDERRRTFVAETITDHKGYYQFYNIKGGTYRVRASLSGHQKPTNFSHRAVILPEHTLRTISFGVIFR